MKGTYRAPSQNLRFGHMQTKIRAGGSVTTTEAQTLEQALHIIEVRQRQNRLTAGKREQAAHPTLAQQLTRAKFFAAGKDISLANGDVHKGKSAKQSERARELREQRHVPHPYRDLPEDAKPAKAREMLASGMWGLGAPCGRRLALLFGVDIATMASWLGIEVWHTKDFKP